MPQGEVVRDVAERSLKQRSLVALRSRSNQFNTNDLGEIIEARDGGGAA